MIVKNILIGEDIRLELGNKISLMGIFGGSLNLEIPAGAPKEMPAALTLAVLISIDNTDANNNPKDFIVQVTIKIGENTFANIKAKIESTGVGVDRIIHLPIPNLQIPVVENVALTIHAAVLKNDTIVSEISTVLDINLNRK